ERRRAHGVAALRGQGQERQEVAGKGEDTVQRGVLHPHGREQQPQGGGREAGAPQCVRGGAQVNVETAIREIKALELTPDTVVVIRTDNFDEALADEFRRQINTAGRPFKVPIVLLPAHDSIETRMLDDVIAQLQDIKKKNEENATEN